MSFTPLGTLPLIAVPAMSPRRIIITVYLVIFAGLTVGAGALFLDARDEYNQLKRAEAESRRRLAAAQAQLEEKKKILERLQNDPAYVERILRERLGYAKPGDFIFRFPD